MAKHRLSGLSCSTGAGGKGVCSYYFSAYRSADVFFSPCRMTSNGYRVTGTTTKRELNSVVKGGVFAVDKPLADPTQASHNLIKLV